MNPEIAARREREAKEKLQNYIDLLNSDAHWHLREAMHLTARSEDGRKGQAMRFLTADGIGGLGKRYEFHVVDESGSVQKYASAQAVLAEWAVE